jgi:predicted RNA-binding Zn-ribbon protein involved in translation (DUF1610 family)
MSTDELFDKVYARTQEGGTRSSWRETVQRVVARVGEFACPRCGKVSYHPEDIRQGYAP